MTYLNRSTYARNGGQVLEPAMRTNGCPGVMCEKSVVGSPSNVKSLISCAHCP